MKKSIEDIIIKVERRSSELNESGERIKFIEEREIHRGVQFTNIINRLKSLGFDLLIILYLTQSVLYISSNFLKLELNSNYSLEMLFFFNYLTYYTLSEFLFQRTIGKLIIGTVVINQYAERPKFLSILKRTVLRLISLFFTIIFEGIFLHKDFSHRLWHDIYSNTYVVNLKERKELRKLLNKAVIL